MIEVFIGLHFGVRQRIAIERHVREKYRNVLPRKEAKYAAAYSPPHYPVPAIRQHYEFGWSLSKSEPVLMHVYSSPYPS